MTRYALYFAPSDGAFADCAARWLGRDAAHDRPVVPLHPDLPPLTETARRYGFHATLKAPFRLADGARPDDLTRAMADFAARTPPVVIAGLQLADLDGFLALVPMGDTTALDAIAARVVQEFDPLRAPLTQAEIARRQPHRLSPNQRALLDAWGYPYVMDEFRFHMTLTDRLRPDQGAWVRPLADATFAPFTGRPVTLDALTLFVEGADGLFHHARRVPLTGAA